MLSSSAFGFIKWSHDEDKTSDKVIDDSSLVFVCDLTDQIEEIFHRDHLARYNVVVNTQGEYLGTFIYQLSDNLIPQGFLVEEYAEKEGYYQNADGLLNYLRKARIKGPFGFNDIRSFERGLLQCNNIFPCTIFANEKDERINSLIEDTLSYIELHRDSSFKLIRVALNSRQRRALDFSRYIGFHLVDDVMMDQYDFGNYLWGAALSRLGVSMAMTSFGSEMNGFFNTCRQNDCFGIIFKGDSDRDQGAIRMGFYSRFGRRQAED